MDRDLTRPAHLIRTSENVTPGKGRALGTVALPDMRRGRVALCVATVLARSTGTAVPYLDYHSPAQAHAAARGQLAYYRALERLGQARVLEDGAALDAHYGRRGRRGRPAKDRGPGTGDERPRTKRQRAEPRAHLPSRFWSVVVRPWSRQQPPLGLVLEHGGRRPDPGAGRAGRVARGRAAAAGAGALRTGALRRRHRHGVWLQRAGPGAAGRDAPAGRGAGRDPPDRRRLLAVAGAVRRAGAGEPQQLPRAGAAPAPARRRYDPGAGGARRGDRRGAGRLDAAAGVGGRAEHQPGT